MTQKAIQKEKIWHRFLPAAWDDYRFDFEGYLVLKNVVSSELIAEINETVDHWVTLH